MSFPHTPNGTTQACDIEAKEGEYVCTDTFYKRVKTMLQSDPRHAEKLAKWEDPNGGTVTLTLKALRARDPAGRVHDLTGNIRLTVQNIIYIHTVEKCDGATLPPPHLQVEDLEMPIAPPDSVDSPSPTATVQQQPSPTAPIDTPAPNPTPTATAPVTPTAGKTLPAARNVVADPAVEARRRKLAGKKGDDGTSSS